MGGESPQASLQADVPLIPNKPQSFNPSFSKAYTNHMPSSYFGNDQVTDPSAILNAYMKYLPDFQKSLQSSNNSNGPSTNNGGQQAALNFLLAGLNHGVGGGSGVGGIKKFADPISGSILGLF